VEDLNLIPQDSARVNLVEHEAHVGYATKKKPCWKPRCRKRKREGEEDEESSDDGELIDSVEINLNGCGKFTIVTPFLLM